MTGYGTFEYVDQLRYQRRSDARAALGLGLMTLACIVVALLTCPAWVLLFTLIPLAGAVFSLRSAHDLATLWIPSAQAEAIRQYERSIEEPVSTGDPLRDAAKAIDKQLEDARREIEQTSVTPGAWTKGPSWVTETGGIIPWDGEYGTCVPKPEENQ